MLYRVALLRRPVVMRSSIISLVLTLLLCISWQRTIQQTVVHQPENVRQIVLAYPDKLKVNGNYVVGTVKDLSSQKQESISMTVRNETMVNKLKTAVRPMILQIEGEVQPILPNTNENQFNFQRYSYHLHTYNRLKVKRLVSKSDLNRYSLIDYCHYLRAALGQYFAEMPSPLNLYCSQLIIGNSSENTTDLMENVKKLGLIHLFCISGMHVVLLISLLRKLLVFLWWDQETIDFALILALPFYLIIGGGATSLIRATLMAEVSLLHRFLNLDALDGWSISLLVGLLFDPLLLMTLGGQLSYLLSLMLQVLPPNLHAFKQSLALNLVGVPSLLSFVYELHLLSFITSYLVIPFFSLFIFPAVIIAACTYRLLPLLADFINTSLLFFQRILAMLAQLPGMIHFGKPPLLLAIILFFLTLYTISHWHNKQGWIMLCGAYLAVMLFIHYPLFGEVAFIDIGQGDSILICEPFHRQVVLIDTGGKVEFGKTKQLEKLKLHDDGEKITVNYLKSKGISHINAIYLSHHDADHIGYLPTLLTEQEVGEVLVPAGMEKQAIFLHKIADKRVKVTPVIDGKQPVGRKLQVLHPFVPGEAKNEDSMVLTGNFGGANFVFTGDLDRNGEKQVVNKYPQLKADILKLGHHGSKTASDLEFLRKLRPKYGIISAGRFNRYHHPDDETIDNLRQTNVIPLSTQQYGMIKYIYCGNSGQIKTYLKGDELRWTLPSCLTN